MATKLIEAAKARAKRRSSMSVSEAAKIRAKQLQARKARGAPTKVTKAKTKKFGKSTSLGGVAGAAGVAEGLLAAKSTAAKSTAPQVNSSPKKVQATTKPAKKRATIRGPRTGGGGGAGGRRGSGGRGGETEAPGGGRGAGGGHGQSPTGRDTDGSPF